MTQLAQRDRLTGPSVRELANQAFSRAASAPLIEGNCVILLKDAQENYPAWLNAIHAAKHYIHFESYIIHEDDSGWMFADALTTKAREGVKVRLPLRLDGGLRQDFALLLESSARGRRRGTLLYRATIRLTVRMDQSRSSQDPYG
jgi:cardiolipin synthase